MSGSPARLYDEDFVRWTEEQAAALREAAGSAINLPLDWENLAEEIDSLGRSLRHELRSRLMVILEHLLKLEYSPAVDPKRGWIETINRERLIVEDLLEESPSLNTGLDEIIDQAKSRAARLAIKSLSDHGGAPRIPLSATPVIKYWATGFGATLPLPANGEREQRVRDA